MPYSKSNPNETTLLPLLVLLLTSSSPLGFALIGGASLVADSLNLAKNRRVATGAIEPAQARRDLEFYKGVVKRSPELGVGYLGCARTFADLGNWESTRRSYTQAIQKYRSAGDLHASGRVEREWEFLKSFLDPH